MVRASWLLGIAVATIFACGGGDGPGPADDDGPDASAQEAGTDEAACEALCTVEARCAEADESCVADCLLRPDLPTDVCRAAYRARNECVGELDCAGYEQWSNPSSGDGRRPCADEEIAIGQACSS